MFQIVSFECDLTLPFQHCFALDQMVFGMHVIASMARPRASMLLRSERTSCLSFLPAGNSSALIHEDDYVLSSQVQVLLDAYDVEGVGPILA